MKVFIIGIAGGVGRRVTERLGGSGDGPRALVRRWAAPGPFRSRLL